MARKEIERLRDLAQEIASDNPLRASGAVAKAIEGHAANLLRDRQFLGRAERETILRRNLDQVHERIASKRHDDQTQFLRYLKRVDIWAASLAGDPTTDPPDDDP